MDVDGVVYAALTAAAGLVFAAAFLWPAVALIGRGLARGGPPDGGYTLTGRQATLLCRSLWLALAGTLSCMVISLPAAYALGRAPRLARAAMMATCLLLTLLCPPMVYAFGWQRLLPAGFDPYAQCLLVWSLWAWPIPAVMLAVGWVRSAARAHEAALLETTPWRAFLFTGLPPLRGYLALAFLILFVLFFNEYGVPHACGLIVYATELLGWAASSPRIIDTLWPSLWPTAITLLMLVMLLWCSKIVRAAPRAGAAALGTAARGGYWIISPIALWLVSWVLPVAVLASNLSAPSAITDAFRIYASDLLWTLLLAAGAGAVSVGVGLILCAFSPFGRTGLIWTLAFGALPAALIGRALVAAYDLPESGWVYDHWPIVLLSYVERFAWIGFAAAWVAVRHTSRTLLDQARVDGASEAAVFFRLLVRGNGAALVCAAAVVAALAVSESAASSMVRVPGFSPVAHILIEKFHRFEDDMLICLSLWLVSAALPAILAAYLTARQQATS